MAAFHLTAQVEEEEDDDYDWDDVEYSDPNMRNYANPKIFGLSPQRFVSLGWDWQLPYDMRLSEINTHEVGSNPDPAENSRVRSTQGLRLGFMVPIISKSSFLWQMSANYWDVNYNISTDQNVPDPSLSRILNDRGLRNANWINTFYIPLDDKQFFIIQGQVDLSGNYTLGNMQSLQFLRYSAAALWGKRLSDRKQWAVGLSRTYRVGNLNYIPVVMYNWTGVSRKWGAEVLFPARAHMRYSFSPRSMLLMGYELEGQSYRISELSESNRSFEIRRGELRPRLDYQQKITGFFWFGIQAGVRMDYSFDADFLENNQEFFRGFFGTQTFAMRNNLGIAPYFNVSLNFVSP